MNMLPMQEAPDNGVCVHHSAMNKLIEETHAMTKIIHLKLGGDLDKKGMITEHCEMYEFFLMVYIRAIGLHIYMTGNWPKERTIV
jgi:hypothetical protein